MRLRITDFDTLLAWLAEFQELVLLRQAAARCDSTSIPGLTAIELNPTEGARLWLAAHSRALFSQPLTTTNRSNAS